MNILLQEIPSIRTLFRKRIPAQLIIQMTDRCNALCPQCGMRATNRYKRKDLEVDEIKRIIDAAAAKGVSTVSFTGGEPFLRFDDLVELIGHAGRCGIRYIRTGTNGFIFMKPDAPDFERKIRGIAQRLAGTKLRNLWISIDSCVPAVHEEMRGLHGVIRGIEKALPILHEYGIYPSANLGANRYITGYPGPDAKAYTASGNETYDHFRDAFGRFYRFVEGMGFTMASTCYPMSVSENDEDTLNPVYGASSSDNVVNFTRDEKAQIYRALLDTIPEFRNHLRIFSPRSSLYALYRQYTDSPEFPYPCRGGVDFFFIDSKDGNTYPCGYRGNENLGKFQDLDMNAVSSECTCTSCDWECFRDPSELFGPLTQAIYDPAGLTRKIFRERPFFSYWLSDLKYYFACDYFDGRRPLSREKLDKFSRNLFSPVFEEPGHGKTYGIPKNEIKEQRT